MSDSTQTWAVLSVVGLGLTSASLLLSDSLPAVVGYSFLGLAVVLGILAVWQADRETALM
ncbi:hypothetical protein SAMN05216226_10392 [Halovenus aranensis]|jgi:hypothetical protein|uniref:Uncharacterized protein n=1 Tax=Halovenus aranensis TaxID=890420 RepID=A0A1G8TL67_9EURY|nr:hypothetical protein [Halovenus aranensis]SDJ41410.1 hypothetical protein SAMN05216226_10392 [Halovenus aranensis]